MGISAKKGKDHHCVKQKVLTCVPGVFHGGALGEGGLSASPVGPLEGLETGFKSQRWN